MTTNNSLQHAIAITERVQIANSMYAGMFEARNLSDDQLGFGHLDVNERLDLKTIAPEASVTIGSRGSCCVQSQHGSVAPPRNIEAVAKV